MTTMRDAVTSVIDRLNGGAVGDLARIANDYVPGDTMIELLDAKPNINPGTVISLDLHVLYVTKMLNNGSAFEFFPIRSSTETVTAGTIARFRPAQTTLEVFDRLAVEVRSMSSPGVGLYQVAEVDNSVNYSDGVYYLPSEWTSSPIRVLGVKGLLPGQDIWRDINGWVWQPERGVVQVYGCPPDATSVRILYALPFGTPTSLDDDLETLGIYHTMHDIPVLGACAYMSMGLEGRRIIPTSQGDPRRAAEVPMTAGTSLSREWARNYQRRTMEEARRLAALYGYRQQDLSSV